MEDRHFVEPDLAFIDAILKSGGGSLKKCYQCATCSVACKLNSDRQPFPRKEMLYAGWGLKGRLLGNPDIWLCHNCGDCSDLCPRGARPGDTLGAIRQIAIKTFAKPSIFNGLWDAPSKIPLLLVFPALIIFAVGFATGWLNLHHEGGPIVYAHFFPVPLIESIFIPLSIGVGLAYFFGIKQMLLAMRANYFERGLSDGRPIDTIAFLKTMMTVLPSIIRHDRFATCANNYRRKRSHILVAVSFFNLALVAGAFVFALYVLNSHGPYSQLNPIKIFANLSGLALIFGALLLIGERAGKSASKSVYFDWYLLVLALLLGVSGMLTQLVRLANWPDAAFAIYFAHLILSFNLIASLPYSKLAHFVYRTVAVTYSTYVRRNRPDEQD